MNSTKNGAESNQKQPTAPAVLENDQEPFSNPLELASNYLKEPILNQVRYSLSRLLAKIPLFSSKRRRRLLHSAAKRDKNWLAQNLNYIAHSHELETLLGKKSRVQFDGLLERERLKFAGSNSHAKFLRAISDDETKSLPQITISFVTYNSDNWLPGLFETLQKQEYPLCKLNLIFVDHGSIDNTINKIKNFSKDHGQKFASITIHRQENLGFGMGHDYSIRLSNDDFVLIANVDLHFHAHSLVTVVKAAQCDLETVASWELRQCPFEHPKYYDPVTLQASWSSYACILLRRSAYLEVGGFEERIFMYGEDVELSYRFRGAGFKLRYVPQATVTHFVDFKNTKLRPDQLSGSVAANVLLRMRYGSEDTSLEGMRLLENALANETDRKRREGLEKARLQVKRDCDHFENQKRPSVDAFFPFNDFDYELARRGHDVSLPCDDPTCRPLVSIITRTHGPNISLLKEAISSVCNQTYGEIEHVIVEDRTDFACSLVSELQEIYGRDIRYIKSKGTGRSSAGNTGLEQSRGEYLMFLDNDDLLFADHVEILTRALIANETAPAAYALGWELPTFFDQNGRYRENAPVHIASHSGEFSVSRLQNVNFLPIQCVMFRRSIFETLGGFDTEIDHLEDWNLWCRYAQAGNFAFVPKTTSLYRVPGDPMFRKERESVMLAAEKSVRVKNAYSFE